MESVGQSYQIPGSAFSVCPGLSQDEEEKVRKWVSITRREFSDLSSESSSGSSGVEVPISKMPCPPGPRVGYTQHYDPSSHVWEWVKGPSTPPEDPA